MEKMNDILKNTKGFAKNPLGIIALFISLIYGFACLVISTAGSNLQPYERIPIIWFMVIFPLIIMFSFLFLVTKHHRKLYGPSDFKDEKIFLETIDIKAQKINLSESTDIKSVELQSNISTTITKSERLKSYLIAENLTLRILEKEYNSPIRRNVKFKDHKNTFDGIIENKDKVIGIEIKYFDRIDKEYFEPIALHYRRRLHSFQRVIKQYFPEKDFLFELVVVENQYNNIFQLELNKLITKENNVKLRFIEFNELKKQFGINENTNT